MRRYSGGNEKHTPNKTRGSKIMTGASEPFPNEAAFPQPTTDFAELHDCADETILQ
jgi:hypothetical protein